MAAPPREVMQAMGPARRKELNIHYRVLFPQADCLSWNPQSWEMSFNSSPLLTAMIGVMRFLQTEWHRHERDRNAWQIERAEMKSRIGKLEGDLRTNKRLRESMDKHIRMLEQAMRKKNQDQSSAPKALDEKPKDTPENKSSAKPSPTLKRKSPSCDY